MRFLFTLIALLSMCLLVSSCDKGKHSDLNRYIKQTKQQSPQSKLPKAKPIKMTHSEYTQRKSRNPFENPLLLKSKKRYPNSILRSYTLDSLRLVGILNKTHHTWAIIATPDGKMHKIQVGFRIGTNQALVTKITKNTVQLLDQSYEEYGQKAKEITLTLGKNH